MDLIVRLFLRLGALLAPPVAPQPVPVPVRNRDPRRPVDPRA
jgi:hypothetical protein